MLSNYIRGVSAGLCISIGGLVYLSCDIKYIGALLFSVALLTICMFTLSLYTGKVGYMAESHTKKDFLGLLGCLLGNLTGCVGFGFISSLVFTKQAEAARIICEAKLAQSIPEALIKAFFCGVLMYVAVWIYKSKGSVAGIFVCVPVFILAGFEHSVANMFYMSVAGLYSINSLAYVMLIVVGNSIGGLFVPVMEKLARCCDGK